jgi:hypothetical protein
LSNTFEWLKRFFIVGIILAVITYLYTNNITSTFWVFIGFTGLATISAFSSTCKNCDNCFGIYEINKRLIDTNVRRIHFTKEVPVGHTERHYHYVNGGTRQTHTEIHYETQDFIKEITNKRYEHSHKCKFCGDITNTYSTSESSRIYRE